MTDCPTCGAAGVPILYGLPILQAREAEAAGHLALAGCLSPYDATRRCPAGHGWIDPDQAAVDAEIIAVLAAHGYEED